MISWILAIICINMMIGASTFSHDSVNTRFVPNTLLSYLLLSNLWIWMVFVLYKEGEWENIKLFNLRKYVVDSFKEVKVMLEVKKNDDISYFSNFSNQWRDWGIIIEY
jgi:hypothetical protein